MSLPLLLCLLAAFLGGPALFLAVLVKSRRLAVRLEQEGLRAQGKVLSVRESPGKPSPVHYTFQPPEGPEVRGKFDEASSLASARAPGSPVEVLYLAEAPEQHTAVGMGMNQRLFLLLAGMLVCFALLGSLTVLHAYATQSG